MLTFKDHELAERLAKKYARPEEASRIKFYAFENLDDNVKDQVRKIKEHPLIPKSIRVSGFIYEVETGKLSGGLRVGRSNARGAACKLATSEIELRASMERVPLAAASACRAL